MTDERKVVLSLTLFDDATFEMDTGIGEKHTGRWDSMKAMMISMGLLMAGVVEDQRKVKRK